ncbi:MAG: hypothetical protein EPO21_03845 [Chloroflexota bacterium]|nr:MAG: hypothetical protein EPO21_03845 [Chloroflexota bacterium]
MSNLLSEAIRKAGDGRGQAMTEAAMALPLFVLVLFVTLSVGLTALGNLVAYAASSSSAWEGSAVYRDALPAHAAAVVGLADKSSSQRLTEARWEDGGWVSGGNAPMEQQALAAARGWLSLVGGLALRPSVTVRTWRTVEIPDGDLRRGYARYLLESRVAFDLPGVILPGLPRRISQATVSRVKEVGPYGSF